MMGPTSVLWVLTDKSQFLYMRVTDSIEKSVQIVLTEG